MGNINIGSLGSLGFHENTLNEYDNEVSEELLEHHLAKIASVYKESDGYVCYVLGMGAQPKVAYTELKKESGVELILTRSVLSGIFKVLSYFIASHAGLVKILNPEKLPNIVKKLCQLSMVGIYIFDKSMEDSFVSRVSKNILPKEFDFGIKHDSRYFFYLVDADNLESSTGMFEVISYGKEASGFAKIM